MYKKCTIELLLLQQNYFFQLFFVGDSSINSIAKYEEENNLKQKSTFYPNIPLKDMVSKILHQRIHLPIRELWHQFASENRVTFLENV